MGISPYPADVRIKNIADGCQVFKGPKFIGEVAIVANWGTDMLARPVNGTNKFFAKRTDAVNYLLEQASNHSARIITCRHCGASKPFVAHGGVDTCDKCGMDI